MYFAPFVVLAVNISLASLVYHRFFVSSFVVLANPSAFLPSFLPFLSLKLPPKPLPYSHISPSSPLTPFHLSSPALTLLSFLSSLLSFALFSSPFPLTCAFAIDHLCILTLIASQALLTLLSSCCFDSVD
jgi:hypothetical protein